MKQTDEQSNALIHTYGIYYFLSPRLCVYVVIVTRKKNDDIVQWKRLKTETTLRL